MFMTLKWQVNWNLIQYKLLSIGKKAKSTLLQAKCIVFEMSFFVKFPFIMEICVASPTGLLVRVLGNLYLDSQEFWKKTNYWFIKFWETNRRTWLKYSPHFSCVGDRTMKLPTFFFRIIRCCVYYLFSCIFSLY